MTKLVSSLGEAIIILVDKAFTNDWFNRSYDLNLEKEELAQLLTVATTNQLFQFDGNLYEQTDGVAMGSPLGPIVANVFMCHFEEKAHARWYGALSVQEVRR